MKRAAFAAQMHSGWGVLVAVSEAPQGPGIRVSLLVGQCRRRRRKVCV
jgi:hypothetical protein